MAGYGLDIGEHECGLPMDEIIGPLVSWQGTTIPWCDIFEELDPRSCCRAQRRDT